MPRIPNIVSEPIHEGLPNSGNPAMGTPDAFGAGVGEAIARGGRETAASGLALGQSIVGAGVAAGNLAQDIDRKMDASATASGVANFDFTADYLDLQKTPPKDGMTYQQSVANAYDAKLDKYLEGMPNDKVRNDVRDRLMLGKKSYVEAAAQYQDKQLVENDKLQADSGLTTLLNGAFVDGSVDKFNDSLTKGIDIINTRPNLTPQMKEAQTKGYTQMLAQRRFEGLINASKYDPEALAAIEGELMVPDSPWKTRMSDEAFTKTLERITTLKHAANSQESTAARSALATVTERNTKGELIDPAEMAAVQSTIMQSKNPALLSQFAMINKAQAIYRENRDLPLDQQRQKIEDMKNKKGITALPVQVQTGIGAGAALTNGAISTEYLAGLVGIEYGAHINSGDYGKGTDVRGPDGKPVTNVKGVAQFSEDTWLATLAAHGSTMGVDMNQSREVLLALRADPELSLKGAALHAADNKRALESSLGRPVPDGDLYFAHLLGLGGATRFLQAATQNANGKSTASVDPAAVANNRPIFYDESGRERTNAQVRAYVADASMNNLSRVDYAGLKAATLVYNNTIKGLQDDAITFAGSTGRFGQLGDVSTPDGMKTRGIVAGQIAEYYKIPAKDFKPFTKSEAEALGKTLQDGDAEAKTKVMMQVQGLENPLLVKAAHKQLGEKDSLFGYAAGLAYSQPDQLGVATDIFRGEARMKVDKDALATIGRTEQELQAAFVGVVGNAVANTNEGTTIRKAAIAYYFGKGGATASKWDPTLFNESVQAVLGGKGNPGGLAIDDVNGAKTLLPKGLNGPQMDLALDRATADDYVALSVFGGAPRYRDGKVILPAEIAREGKFEAIGNGQYKIKMGDGNYALTGAYKDGSVDFYIFRGDPERMKIMSQRSSVTVPLKPIVPGVTPAVPRVIP